jgi:hypothetical protein
MLILGEQNVKVQITKLRMKRISSTLLLRKRRSLLGKIVKDLISVQGRMRNSGLEARRGSLRVVMRCLVVI